MMKAEEGDKGWGAGVALRRLVVTASHYGVGRVLSIVAGFVTLPILTRIFSRAEYGFLGLVTVTVTVFTSVAKGGLQHAGIRFFPAGENEDDSTDSRYYTTLFVGSFGLAAGAAGLILIINLAKPVAGLIEYAWLVAALVFVESMIVRMKNFLRAEGRSIFFNVIGVGTRWVAIAFGLIGVLLIERHPAYFLGGGLVARSGVLAFLLVRLWKKNVLRTNAFSLPFLREILTYGLPLIAFEMSSLLIKFADRYMIEHFLNLNAVGLYSLGANLAQYLQDLVFFPVSYAIFPLYMKLWRNKGREETEIFLGRAMEGLALFVVPLVVGFCAISRDFTEIVASSKFLEASKLVPYITVGAILWGMHPVYAAGLFIYKKTATISVLVFAGALFNIVLNRVMIVEYGIMGAAYATLITFSVLSVTTFVVASKTLEIVPKFRRLGTAFVASAVMYYGVVEVGGEVDELMVRFVSKIIVGAVVYSVMVFAFDQESRRLFSASGVRLYKRVWSRTPGSGDV